MARTLSITNAATTPSARPAIGAAERRGADTTTGAAPRRIRRHRSTLRQIDRRALERDGWRTTLEYRENHARLRDGRLVDVDARWVAEAERDGCVISVTARSESRAWSDLRGNARRAPEEFSAAASA